MSSLLEAKSYKLKLSALWKGRERQDANFVRVLVHSQLCSDHEAGMLLCER